MFRDCVYWIGVVENNVDPQKRGRVQVRVFGAHDMYNPPMTDSEGRTSWGASYGGSVSAGSMPRFAVNERNKLDIWQCYNNPMNIRLPGSKEYRRFDDISMAYPHYYWQLKRYYSGATTGTPLRTPRQIIATWAPAFENNLSDYYRNANLGSMGMGYDTPIDINNMDQVATLFRGMTIAECSQNFSVEDIKSAMAGNIVPSMTAVSTLYKDGQLYTGTSNAVEGVSGTSGEIPRYSSGLSENAEANKQAALESAKKQQEAAKETNTDSKNVQVEQKPAEATQTVTRGPDTTGHQLPTEDLPWAVCLYSPVEYGGTTYSTLPAPQIQNGAMVFGISIDGDFMNQLFIIGIIPTINNIDVLSTNPNEANANNLGSLSGVSQMTANSIPNIDSAVPIKSNSGITMPQMVNGVWNAESSKSTNKKVSSSYAYGAMQVMPALAAGYLLDGNASEQLQAAGWSMDQETIDMLNEIRYGNGGSGYWGSEIADLINSNEKVANFCQLLQDNDALNMAIGTAYLRDCSSSAQGNGDPILTALYYNQGVPNTHKILDAMGISDYNNIPSSMTYDDFIDGVNSIIKPSQNNDFRVYVDNIFRETGGVASLQQNRTN